MDTEMMDAIDKFAKEHGIDRNRAILELLESGYTNITGEPPVTLNQKRSFEEYHDLRTAVEKVQKSLEDLTGEIQLIHHIMEVEGREMKPVPFQSRKWWELWKTP
jgi:hypothetical protein